MYLVPKYSAGISLPTSDKFALADVTHCHVTPHVTSTGSYGRSFKVKAEISNLSLVWAASLHVLNIHDPVLNIMILTQTSLFFPVRHTGVGMIPVRE